LTQGGDGRAGRVAAAALAIVALGAAAYGNSFAGPFVFDDKVAIAANDTIRRLSPLSDVLFSATNATVAGRPLLNLSFALSWAAHGPAVAGWHAENLVIHLLAGLALFGVARRTFAAPRVPALLAARATGLAAAIALLWTVHPLQTESVSYVCQRAESMAGLFVLVTLLCAIRGAGAAHGRAWTVASVTACLLAVGTKETAAAAPILVLLHDRTFVAGSFREALRRRPGLYAGLFATWAVLAALMVSSHARAGTAGFGQGVGSMEYAATQPGAIAGYLRASVWPHPLVFDHGAPLARTAAEIVPGALLVGALVAATLVLLRTRPLAGFVGACFFLLLAPTSSVVPLATQTIAEHRMYLPLAAVLAAIVLAGHALLGRAPRVAAGAAVVAAVLLAAATHARNDVYRDELALWRDTADRAPANDRAQVNCGMCLADTGDLAGALARFDRAIAIDPRNAVARGSRGDALVRLGRLDDAATEFTEMLRVIPDWSAAALNGRGKVRQAQHRDDLALADFDAALAQFAGYGEARANRARSRLALGDRAGALADVEECRRLGFVPDEDLVRAIALGR
jgi:Tfp pilus assembly protein PilF